MPADIYTGEHAKVWLSTKEGTALGIADFSITVSRDIVEQPLMSQKGPWRSAGPITIEGSFTQAKFLHSPVLDSLQAGTYVSISGQTADNTANGLSWYFENCIITRFDVSMGDASTVTTATVDYVVIDAYNIGTASCWISGTTS